MSIRKRSEVWAYYEEHTEIPSKVVCQICSEKLNHSGNTSNMLKHLKTKHPNEFADVEGKRKKGKVPSTSNPSTTSTSRQPSVMESFSRSGVKYPGEYNYNN